MRPPSRLSPAIAQCSHRDRGQSSAVCAGFVFLSEVPPEASRVSGRLRSGCRYTEHLGGSADRPLTPWEGALADVLPAVPGGALVSGQGGATAGRLDCHEPRDPDRRQPGRISDVGPPVIRLSGAGVLLLHRPPSTGRPL